MTSPVTARSLPAADRLAIMHSTAPVSTASSLGVNGPHSFGSCSTRLNLELAALGPHDRADVARAEAECLDTLTTDSPGTSGKGSGGAPAPRPGLCQSAA
jgi:hypothetical protein